MRRKYKIGIIILVSIILTYIIYFCNKEDKINLVAIGDGIASGETSYNIDGISYNDYVKEYFESKNLLKNYNNDYAFENYELNELINDIKTNVTKNNNNLNIQQIIHKANLITLTIGEEELIKLSVINDLNKEYIDKFISEYDNLLYLLKDISDATIVILGFYENEYLDRSNVIILNAELSNIAIKYESIFININDLLLNKEYYLDNKAYHFNYKGHKEIAEMIIHSL